jgi:anti-anti-sigma factor
MLLLTLTGSFDRATAGQLAEAVFRASELASRVVLDLREVTFMDIGGLNAVLDAQSAALRERCELKLIRGPRCVQRVFELTGTAGDLCFECC